MVVSGCSCSSEGAAVVEVFVYARQSRYRGGGMSPNCEIQVEECKEYAAQRGDRVVGVFKDVDISASQYSTKPRSDYEAMLEGLRRGEAQGVLCTEMPRLYRRLEELLDVIHLATQTRLRRIMTTDNSGYDLSTGEGIHNAVSAVNNAVLESRRLSDRIRRSKRAKAKGGEYHGGPRPYGYEGPVKDEYGNVLNKDRIGKAVVEHEAAIVREVVSRLKAGEGMGSIVGDLNRRGLRTARGKYWQMTTMKRLLMSKRIIGIRSHNGVDYPAEWHPLLSKEDWEQVQLILRAEDASEEQREVRARRYFLTGFLECGSCHAKMVGRNWRRPGDPAPRPRYVCQKLDTRGMKRGCGKTFRLAEPIDRLVAEAILYRYDTPELAAALRAVDQGEQLQALLNAYSGQKLKLDELIRDYASGLLNREQLALAKSVVEDAMEVTRKRLTETQTGRALAAIPPGQTVREAWESADVDWRRSLIDLVVRRIVVHPGRFGATRWRDSTGREWNFDPNKIEILWKL
jgi:site-specific DNA recombinase